MAKKKQGVENITAERMAALFAGHDGAHGTHGEPVRDGLKWEIKTTAQTIKQPPTVEMWRQHLEGIRPIGIIPIRPDSTCKWGSIDVDEYDEDHARVVEQVERGKFPLVPCISKSGGLHLFLFLAEPQPASVVIAALRGAAAALGLAGSEIFPKQAQILSARGDVGNWMVMPYFGGTFGGKLREQRGLKRTGMEQTIGEFLSTAEAARVSSATLEELAARAEGAPPPGQRRKPRGNGTSPGDFSDGPVCMEHLRQTGLPEGGRNSALFMAGIYYKRIAPVDWQQRVEEYNREHNKPPLTADEVTACVRQLQRKDYNYTCKVEPMVRHCHSKLCRTRKYGVGDEGEYPVISGLTMLDSDPPIWFVNIGDERIEVDAETLQNYPAFHRAAMKHGMCFAMMKQADWLATLGRAFRTMQVDKQPPDVSVQAKFSELLEEFCTNNMRGERREDILSGRPWEDQEKGRYYFRLKDLEKYLYRENTRNVTRNQMAHRIKTLGGARSGLRLTPQRSEPCWWVPTKLFQGYPELPTPGDKGEPI